MKENFVIDYDLSKLDAEYWKIYEQKRIAMELADEADAEDSAGNCRGNDYGRRRDSAGIQHKIILFPLLFAKKGGTIVLSITNCPDRATYNQD